jgi:hypothetical protein
VVLIEAFTKREGIPYLDYVRGASLVPRAVIVKDADLDDNSDPARVAGSQFRMRSDCGRSTRARKWRCTEPLDGGSGVQEGGPRS